jgi:hypothetical protein
VTGAAIPVRAQWALHGKVPDDEGYRVIACSNGDLNRANFADALGRFTLGALGTLPQVSVSYLQPASSQPGAGYLALAVHWFAADGQRRADGVLKFDNQGRPTAFTSYFCVPYAQLAAHGCTYLDMYKAFSTVTLPAHDGPPREVAVTAAAQRVPAIDGTAMRAAALLLTGVPVCVLGADETSMEERLGFIDTVMGLLPYGFRARMTAATWTRATNRNHRFRLFFSSEPRSSAKPDHLVSWGEPELAAIPGGHAGDYYGWLADKVTPLASLAQLNGAASFGDSADSQALYLVDSVRLWRRPRLRPAAPAVPTAPDKRVAPRPGPAAGGGDPVEALLRECVEHARLLNLARLRQDLSLLQHQVDGGAIDADRRRRYRSVIARSGLLRANFRLGRYEGKLFDTLLPLAFGTPVGYPALCQAEDCLRHASGPGLHRALLEAIDRAGLDDTRSKAIVYASLDGKKLARWLGSKEVDAYGLVTEIAEGGWHRQEHGRLVCGVLLGYLRDRQGRYSPAEIRRVLLRSGYLAQPLRRLGDDQFQLRALTELLAAAYPAGQYPNGPDRETIAAVLTRADYPPTPALLAAILGTTPAAAAPLAWEAFVYGSVTHLDLDPADHDVLWPRLPALTPAPVLALDPAPEVQPST